MSADNFVQVKRFDDGWYWSMGSASVEYENNILPDDYFKSGPFKTVDDACQDAHDECMIIEYGIEVVTGSKNDVVPTKDQQLETQSKLIILQSKRIMDLLKAKDNALEALKPKNKKEKPNIDAAIEALKSSSENEETDARI